MAAALSTGPTSVVRPLDQKDANRLINKYVVDEVITRTYEIIISWGCPKLPNETFFDFIKGRNKDEKLLKGNETKLNTTVSDEFDVDFLAKLLPVVCDYIEKSGNTEWNKRNKVVTSVEHLIKEAKDLRNEVTHERKGSAIATDVHQKALSILPNLVISAGKLYNKKDCDVQSEISNVESWLRKAKQMTDRITRINNIKTKLTKPLEMKDNFVKFYGRETLACGSTTVTLSDVFHCITLMVGQVGKTTKEMSCKDIFLPWLGTSGDKVNCLIIEGVAGSGKTTLLKRIGLDAVQATDNIFQSVDQFDFLIFIECRKSISSFRDLMRVCLPETLKPFEIEDAIEAARQLNPLILIDGLDELNSDSRKLLNESVELFKRNSKAMFVVTCRPYAGISFRIDLDKEGIIHQTASIKELSEVKEQKEFLARYQEQIPSIKSPELINAYVKLVENCFSHFQYPVYLVLFCHLFKISPAEVSKWTSEASVMEQTLQLSKEKMSERLRQRSIRNPKIIINEVIDAVCKLCLECLHGDLMSVTSIMYDKFCQDCRSNISKSVEYEEVISSILVLKCSMYATERNEYTFFHNSHREFLAAKAVTALLSNDSKLAVKDLLRNGSDELDDEIIRRFLNTLRFVMMSFTIPGQERLLQQRLPEIGEIISSVYVGWEYWSEVVASCPHSLEIAQLAAAARCTLNNSTWWVTSPHHVLAASLMLPHGQPPTLYVDLPPSQPAPAETLDQLLAAVTQYHTGVLHLILRHSYKYYQSCDEILLKLKGARCRLTEFRACVSGDGDAIRVLVQMGYGFINCSMSDPTRHQLHLLESSIVEKLSIKTKPRRESDVMDQLRPLPVTRMNPVLIVDEASTVDESFETILFLVPVKNRYLRLELQSTTLSDAELDDLLMRLHSRAVRTTESNREAKYWREVLVGHAQYWWEAKRTEGAVCLGCHRSYHVDGLRCIVLHIPVILVSSSYEYAQLEPVMTTC